MADGYMRGYGAADCEAGNVAKLMGTAVAATRRCRSQRWGHVQTLGRAHVGPMGVADTGMCMPVVAALGRSWQRPRVGKF